MSGVVDRQAPPAIARVIEGGFCVGCGACSAIDPAFDVRRAQNGEFRVEEVPADPAALARAGRVCPFAEAPDEDELAAEAFPDAPHRHDGIGRYVSLHAGWSEEQRGSGGSGGLTRWLMAELLRTGAVDYVVAVDQSVAGGPGEELFRYTVHEDADSYLREAGSSAYYPVTLQGLFEEIAARPGRCAVTALPCFARAIRAVIRERPEFAGKVRFVSGVICGSLKSRRYAEYLAHQLGVPPEDLARINFRGKSLSRAATEKCVEVWRRGDDPAGEPTAASRVQDLDGTRYDLGYFKYKACDWCDDVLAETADIAFGDAWLQPYSRDPRGTNVVVVRNPALASVLEAARADGRIHLDPLGAEEVAKSQGGGLRHRRDGLAIRLAIARAFGRWTPRKRVRPRWGGPAATIVQVRRVGVRIVTRADRIRPTGRALPLAVGGVLAATRLADAAIGIARRLLRRGEHARVRADRPGGARQ